jgi:SAM-dependent methyltransferase
MTNAESDPVAEPTLPDAPLDRIASEALRSTVETTIPWEGRLLQLGGSDPTTRWLVSQGHEVCRCVADSARAADRREAAARAGIADSVTVTAVDRLSLPFADDTLDGACWFGHGISTLTSQSDRIDAVSELGRVVAPDGLLFVTGVGRFGALRTELVRDPETVSQSFTALAEDGQFTADRVGPRATAQDDGNGESDLSGQLPPLPYHGFRLDHFERELVEADIVVDRVVGLDSFLAGIDGLEDLSPAGIQRLGKAAERVNSERSVADGASRLLAVCRVTAGRGVPGGL